MKTSSPPYSASQHLMLGAKRTSSTPAPTTAWTNRDRHGHRDFRRQPRHRPLPPRRDRRHRVYPGGQWAQNDWPDPQPGDELTMTGALSEYNGLLEVGPDGITDVTVLSTGNELPAFQTITPNDMDESMEGELAYPGRREQNPANITGNSTFSHAAGRRIIYVQRQLTRWQYPLVGRLVRRGFWFSFDGVGCNCCHAAAGPRTHVSHQLEHPGRPDQHHHRS